MSAAYRIVITSGGLGPTLDDVTMAAVAHALEYPVVRCAIALSAAEVRLIFSYT